MSQPLSLREWEERQAAEECYEDEQRRRDRHMPVILDSDAVENMPWLKPTDSEVNHE